METTILEEPDETVVWEEPVVVIGECSENVYWADAPMVKIKYVNQDVTAYYPMHMFTGAQISGRASLRLVVVKTLDGSKKHKFIDRQTICKNNL